MVVYMWWWCICDGGVYVMVVFHGGWSGWCCIAGVARDWCNFGVYCGVIVAYMTV